MITFRPEDVPLRRDVNTLGRLLGGVLQDLGSAGLFDRVEAARQTAIDRRAQKPGAEERFLGVLAGLSPAEGIEVVRAFAAYFDLVNMAERVHRIRRRRDYLQRGVPQPESLTDVLAELRKRGVEADAVTAILADFDFTPVFTAHPTEATRRTLLAKQQRMARALVDRLDPDAITPPEEQTALARVRSEVGIAWQTEPHATEPTVADEVEHVVFFLSDVVYRIVPTLYQRLEQARRTVFGPSSGGELPRLLRFASWVGGDMDGNPNVGASTIRSTLHRHRQLVLQRYRSEMRQLFDHMSHSRSRVDVLPVIESTIERYREILPDVYAQIPPRYHAMPYRLLLWLMNARIDATGRDADSGYGHPRELLSDLRAIRRSLDERSGPGTGQHRVQRLIRRVEAFGFHLATLDIRQDAGVHRDAIGELLGREDYVGLPPGERLAVLESAWSVLATSEPRGGKALARCLEVMRMLSECRRKFGPEAIGPYIVSRASGVDDVLSVLALARVAGLLDDHGDVPLDVAPLFETVPDLDGAEATFAALLAHPTYAAHLVSRQREQVIMLGYSDSNKESGIAASRWALYGAQERLAQTASANRVRLTLFHGRGGTISRGGGKPREGILAEPPGSVSGRLRITEQGEIIAMKYGLRDIAARTLELMLGAALEHTATAQARPPIPAVFREAAACVAQHSRAAYRALVYDDPQLPAYFRAATPIDVIERLRIGSRPPARSTSGSGIERLRAIPWVFAWTQSRHLLPGWFGLGSGLAAARAQFGEAVLAQMVREWPFFANLIKDAEMVLAQTDLGIAAHYAALFDEAAPPGTATSRDGDGVFARISREHARTVEHVCLVQGTSALLEREPVLQRAIRLRNPYVDPMSLLQVDYLRRWRAGGRADRELELALMTTVRGIAQGLQNTG